MTDVEVPAYDPEVHTLGENPTVLVELWCACGGVWRQIDPVSHVRPQIAGFAEKHTGQGHGVVPGKVALAEREARREAGFRAAGRQHEYEPKTHEAPAGPGLDWAAIAAAMAKEAG